VSFTLPKTSKARLRSLFDVRVIRAAMNSPAFNELVAQNLARRRYIGSDHTLPQADFIITGYGELVGRRLFERGST
jgi:hypothetical protein